MWDLIVLIPDHCLSIHSNERQCEYPRQKGMKTQPLFFDIFTGENNIYDFVCCFPGALYHINIYSS